jgi:G3E family GTPase
MEATIGRRVIAVVRDITPLFANGTRGARREGVLAEWPNGCLSIASEDPTATLAVLARQVERPEHVIVEASSATNPRRLGGYAYMPGYRPDGTVMVVDAAAASQVAPDHTFDTAQLAQLRAADVVVLNKLDLAGPDATSAAQRSLAPLAPSARFLWCRAGRIAPPLILGPAGGRATPSDPTVVVEWRPDYLPVRSQDRKTLIGELYQSWCLLTDAQIESREFRGWVGRLPASIVRGTGVVHLREDPEHRHEFSLMGSRWELGRGAPWGKDAPSTRITLVGVGGHPRRSFDGGASVSDDDMPADPRPDPTLDDLSRMVM